MKAKSFFEPGLGKEKVHIKDMARTYLNNFKRLNVPPSEWLLMDRHLHRSPQYGRAQNVLAQSKGNVDIIGDVHASFDRLTELLSRLGWRWDGAHLCHKNPSRRVIFIGDIVDGGDENLECLRLCMSVVRDGMGVVLMGNHDWMLLAWLKGVMQPAYNGAQDDVVLEFEDCKPEDRLACVQFLQDLCETVSFSHPILGEVECVHASPFESVEMLPLHLKEDKNARLCAPYWAFMN